MTAQTHIRAVARNTCNRLMESKLVKRGESQLTTFRQPIMSEYRTRSGLPDLLYQFLC